jgi:Kef-type K+ transport system membrane component KefB
MHSSPLLLQLVIILGTARVLGIALRYFGQPAVVGEMAAGIVLGPIVFGALLPEAHAHVFAPGSLSALGGLSQVGLVLFMFIIGAEVRTPTAISTSVNQQIAAIGWIGILSVALPMMLGTGAAALLYESLAPPDVTFWPFALFMASAMAITAFPVMARILKERGLTHTTVGRMSLSSAAIADVLAWMLLGLVIVLAGSERSWSRFAVMAGGTFVLGLLLMLGARPALSWLIKRFAADGRPEGTILAALLIGAFACAYATDALGVHAVFGAFLFGLCVPRDDRLLATLIERIQHLSILILMPIFFALAGLNTTTDALSSAALGALGLIVGVAICGKIVGGTLGARLGGQPWRSSFAIGSLMNARGMTELIVIQVGLDIGVIGKDLFTMLMIMALVTTVMTGPLLSLFSERPAAAPAGKIA